MRNKSRLKTIAFWALLVGGIAFFRAVSPPTGVVLELPKGRGAGIFTALGGEAGRLPVVLFMAEWCGYCRALKKDLVSAGIPFVSVDVEKNPLGEKFFFELAQKIGPGIPVTIVGEQVFQGYEPAAILREARKPPG